MEKRKIMTDGREPIRNLSDEFFAVCRRLDPSIRKKIAYDYIARFGFNSRLFEDGTRQCTARLFTWLIADKRYVVPEDCQKFRNALRIAESEPTIERVREKLQDLLPVFEIDPMPEIPCIDPSRTQSLTREDWINAFMLGYKTRVEEVDPVRIAAQQAYQEFERKKVNRGETASGG